MFKTAKVNLLCVDYNFTFLFYFISFYTKFFEKMYYFTIKIW